MSEAFTVDDLEALAATLEPVTPPAEVKLRILSAIRSVPQNSHTVRADEGSWIAMPHRGVSFKKLSRDAERGTVTLLMRFEPGSIMPAHDHRGAEDSFVVSGSCRIGGVSLRVGDFHRVDAGERHEDLVSDEGCTLLLTIDEKDYRAA